MKKKTLSNLKQFGYLIENLYNFFNNSHITAKLTYYLDPKNHILQEASELWSRMETGFWQTRW